MFVPVWLCWLACFLLPDRVLQQQIPLWVWVVFVLGIDVGHVWSTIFRTYLDTNEFRRYKKLLLGVPLLAFPLLFGLALWSEFWFWRLLAYLALFHFVKQQYGFLAIYRGRGKDFLKGKLFNDKLVIYFSMLYPVLYWHLGSDRQFNWFVPGDFLTLALAGDGAAWLLQVVRAYLLPAGNVFYGLVMAGWLAEEWWRHRGQRLPLVWPKVLWLLTTAGNWYLGIVWFNSDLAFTLTNVVAHGIPYVALVYFYKTRKQQRTKARAMRPAGLQLLVMLLAILLLAFGEEYLWDMLLNREKQAFFSVIAVYPLAAFSHPVAQSLALAALSLPQVWHYVVDGFIWKSGKGNEQVKQVLAG